MKIRQLEDGDMDALLRFISDSYDDYPVFMWFNSKPPKENMERIFYNKIKGLGSRLLADFVAEEGGVILGECEIVRTYGECGVVGIMIRKEFGRKRLGTKLLDSAIESAKEIGILRISAEVMAENEPALRFFIVNGFRPVGSRAIERKGKQHNMAILERTVK